MTTSFNYTKVHQLAACSAVHLQNCLNELMKMKILGIHPKDVDKAMESAEMLTLALLLPNCDNNLDQIIDVLSYVLLIVHIKQKNEQAALDMIKNGVKVTSMRDGIGPLDYAIESKMTAVILELLLRHDAELRLNCFKSLDEVLKEEPLPLSEVWEKIKDMMIDKLLSGFTELARFRILSLLLRWKSSRAKEVLEAIDENQSHRSDIVDFMDCDLLGCDSAVFEIFIRKFGQFFYDYYKLSRSQWCARAIRLSFQTYANMDMIISNLEVLLKSSTFSKQILDELNGCAMDRFCAQLHQTGYPRDRIDALLLRTGFSRGGFYIQLLSSVDAVQIPSDQFAKLVELLQNSDFPVNTDDMDAIFRYYGYESAFKCLLLLKPVTLDLSKASGTAFARFYYDPKWTLERAMKVKYFDSDDLKYLLGYFAHPKVKALALRSGSPSVAMKVSHLPEIPSLVELARNTARKYIVDQVRDFRQLHSEANRLPIPRICARILLFEERIY